MDFRFVYENKSFKDDEEERQFIAQLYNEQAVKDSFKAVLNQILNEIDSKDFYEAWPLYNENGDQIIGKVVISSDMQQITPTQYSIFTNENSEEEEEEFIPSGKYCDCCGAYINTPAGESYFGTLNPSNSTHEGEHSYCYNCHEAICMSKDHITEFNALSGDLYVIKDSDGSIFYYCYDHKELSGTNSSCIKVIELPPTLSPSPYDNENPPEPESIPSPTPVE